VLEGDDLVDHRCVLLRHRVDGLDPVDEVGEAVRPEDDGERRLVVARRVDRDETLLEGDLGGPEVRAGDAERLAVDLQVPFERVQLLRRELIAAVRALGARVELAELREDGLDFGPLRGDGVGADARRGRTRRRDYEEE
jgi:hypothetical protein